RLLTTTQPQFTFDDRDVWTLFHSYAFDFSVWEMWGALVYGGRLVIVPSVVARSPRDFHQLLVDARVTVLNQTPSAFQRLLAVDLERPEADLRLRYLIFGGEALDVASLAPWFDRHGTYPRVVNMYGITETTVHVTYREITAEDLHLGSVVGKPLSDLAGLVLDGDLRQVPVGVAGELYVSGAGLARGYLGRPGLTASRYVPNPYSTTPGARAYRTGDVVRRRDSGELEYLGRSDHQVKIRGFRVELGEIEHALVTLPLVRAARVALREEGSQKQLVAYVIPVRRGAFDRSTIAARLSAVLPAYMVPSAFVPLDAFPLTPHGKLDVSALPPPTAVDHPIGGEFVAPSTEIERAMAAIWADVLRVPRVGIDDDFFAVGGDSMSSLQLQSRAEAAGLSFALADLFGERTIRRIAPRTTWSAVRPAAADPEALSQLAVGDRELIPDGIEDAYPLSYLQAGMLFESELRPESRLYRDIFSHHLKIAFDAGPFRAMLDRLAARHPALRTYFDLSTFSEPLQLVRRT
ncbi:MAG: AMP-binding protein, partial [Longimicrobiales bacterium]